MPVLDAVHESSSARRCSSAACAAFLSLAFGTLRRSGGKEFRAGGYARRGAVGVLAEYLNRTGSIILILTLLFLAIILSTQFSFGRLFAAIGSMMCDQWAAHGSARCARGATRSGARSSARRC